MGDLILYGRTGVCRVVAIGADSEDRQCYTLQPLYQKCSIKTPVDNGKVFMRPIISKEEAERVIEAIPTIKPCAYHNCNLTQLKEHYREWLDRHDCLELVAMTMSLYEKRREAEELLFGELAAALGCEKSAVAGYISSRMAAMQSAAG
ncbi:MAG: CarD family transcriptional regulator [Oscillospiraceae bacterium]|nr:CarD family transcriptional regulator [Oscillospiraceae bacterium]